jgi:hypothetical protein
MQFILRAEERVFLVATPCTQKTIACNLRDLQRAVNYARIRNTIEPQDKVKVFHMWNCKLTRMTKSELKDHGIKL